MKIPLINNTSFLFFIVIAIVSSTFWILGDATLKALMYQRDAISTGQVWRLISGHFVHSNGWHLLLNISSLLMIGMLFSRHLTLLIWCLVFMVSGLLVSACYYLIAPEFNSYVGLSAILYGVFIIGALLDFREQPLISMIILIVVTGRVIWQQFYGAAEPLAELIENRVAIESHLFGLVAGYAQGLLLLFLRKNTKVVTPTKSTK